MKYINYLSVAHYAHCIIIIKIDMR